MACEKRETGNSFHLIPKEENMKPSIKSITVILAAVILAGAPFAFGIEGNTAPCGKLTGVIKDSQTGKPIQNVYISVENCPTAAMTSESGRFYLNEIPAGMCKYKISRRGYKPIEGSFTVENKKTGTLSIELEKQPVPVQAAGSKADDKT
jgi:hypothetical protein